METLLSHIRSRAAAAFSSLGVAFTEIDIAQTKHADMGDYQCNSAMRFGKAAGKNPRELAESVKAMLVNDPLFETVSVAGPGFINFVLRTNALESYLKTMLAAPDFGLKAPHPEKVIVDFSSPNVAKEMHVGHLRSTIIGDCLARVFEFLGHDVLRLNHIGDWGTAFGMLIAHMEQVALAVLQGHREASLSDLMQWYRESKKHFDEDPEFKRSAQLKVVALQGGDPEAVRAWQIICDISAKAYQEIYDLLDVNITTRGESFYNPYLATTVSDLNQKHLITESAGAKCIFLPGFLGKEGEPLPLIVQKSDGGFNYAATDLAALWHRVQVEKGERLLYVVDAGQSVHLSMVFAAGKKAGYATAKTRLEHVPFGLVLGADGKKFKTRSGDTEKLVDLLTTAIAKSAEILQAREMPPQAIAEMARALGINAVKYADLSCNRAQDYQFSYERMLRFEGNTAAFIMYSLVRILSIQRKVGAVSLNPDQLRLVHPAERALALHLAQFSETLHYVATELYPHRLTDYLYQLANAFNVFFRDCRVEGAPEGASRLTLLELTGRVFKTGMHLLGLSVLERM